ncbi:hypothetical protein [Bradyrhizobium sp. URHD0069]|uniref:hypothetical protein n=1 Tax=Bradyrhizobium sp. URHD0069 TaxID=1380355 RepID=UPI0012DC4F21|nr:hypothetical protein [Bradyrhizobium sp. URHD0069]
MAQADKGDLPDGTSEMFFSRGLDDPNHIEISAQIEVYARPPTGVSLTQTAIARIVRRHKTGAIGNGARVSD